MPITQHLPDDLLDRHLSAPAVAGAPFIDSLERTDENERHGGRNHVPSDPVLHHAKGRDPGERRKDETGVVKMAVCSISVLAPRARRSLVPGRGVRRWCVVKGARNASTFRAPPRRFSPLGCRPPHAPVPGRTMPRAGSPCTSPSTTTRSAAARTPTRRTAGVSSGRPRGHAERSGTSDCRAATATKTWVPWLFTGP